MIYTVFKPFYQLTNNIIGLSNYTSIRCSETKFDGFFTWGVHQDSIRAAIAAHCHSH